MTGGRGRYCRMHTLTEMAKVLNRPALEVRRLQSRFALPAFDGAGYSEAYLAFLRTVVHLRRLSVSEESLRELWHTEKKLLELLHADSSDSPTWFLDSCRATARQRHRLLLTNFDLGGEAPGEIQFGLNFSASTPELFAGKEMGEDALRVLNDYRKLHARIRAGVKAELPQVRAAAAWAKRV